MPSSSGGGHAASPPRSRGLAAAGGPASSSHINAMDAPDAFLDTPGAREVSAHRIGAAGLAPAARMQ